MKVTIIYDNMPPEKKGLQAEWGFSALVEMEDTPKILFDTGANGKILLENMRKLDIAPSSIEELFISHDHFDHIGGLYEFMKVNPVKKIYVPSSLGVKNEIITKEAQKIHENIFSTGELEGIEQSMGVLTEKGIVLIVGCSHPYMGTILEVSRQFGEIYGIVGGLHGFSRFELFKDLKLICPTHCTQHQEELKQLYPQKYVKGGAGTVIEIRGSPRN
jgi:7,8-dihydropterin-6-yl-methyl-4-(beta-D-ribofuranosyl)aminobenzene 5'-phosphate synthase